MEQTTQLKQTKGINLSGLWLPILFVLTAGGLLLALILGVLAYQIAYLERVYPGVRVADIDVGGMTRSEVMVSVSAHTPPYLSRSITLLAGSDSWTFTGRELGMQVDVKATAHKALAIGRKGNFLTDVLTQLRLLSTPRTIEPVLLYDNGLTIQALQQVAEQIELPPRDAQLVIQPDGRVEATSARRGRRLIVEATRPLLEEAVFRSDNEPVVAVVQEILPGITDTEPARQQVEYILGAPLVFRFNHGEDQAEWRLERQTLVKMIDVVRQIDSEGKTQFHVTIDEAAFAPYLQEFARGIDREPRDARLSFNPDTRQVVVLQESQNGRRLDLDAAYQQVLALKEGGSHFIDLSVQDILPDIPSDNVDKLGIKELVSESTSYFKGSSKSRMHNIALAASRFHDVVVPPGQIFSFNENLGPVTAESGFDESLIIEGNRTAVGIGGGVCQVSTTAFRVAFFGGYEIVERWAHGYRVGWYETKSGPGLDATIYTPTVDFKFRNDTDYYVLIQTETDQEAGTLTFRFYSTDPGREVVVGEPKTSNLVKHGPPIYEDDPTLPEGTLKQVDWASDGLDVTVERIVKEAETIIHHDVVESHYRPWRAIYKVGTGE